tara:strand:+ start:230 stop:808 length:579 start_codon:yes stop_codon:yes gene_type:complete
MTHSSIQTFLTALQAELSIAPRALREELLQEVESHLLDVDERGGEAAVKAALQGFGAADSYAAQALEAHGLQAALADPSAGRLWSTALTYAGRSLVVLVSTVVGFTFAVSALALLATAVTEMIAPELTGLFMGDGRFAFGILPPEKTAGLDDPLGIWIAPLSIFGAVLLAISALGVLRMGFKRRLMTLRFLN